MNIKRAFFAAVATLMVPAFAMAQTTISFDTVLDFQPDGPYTQTVTATLTCNTGNPLVQSFEIGPQTTDKVVFVVENFSLVDFISCEITTTTVTGFDVFNVVVNGTGNPTADSCLYVPAADVVAGESVELIEGLNTCLFGMAPSPFTFEIEKVWEIDGDDVISEFAAGSWNCVNVVNPGVTFGGVTTASGFWDISGDGTYVVGGFTGMQVNPWADAIGEFTRCTATESFLDSAVESDQGCAGGTVFTLADPDGSCLITNTVFFEGIPTLSQYGLAVMALLMLGVGFIGFRRFV